MSDGRTAGGQLRERLARIEMLVPEVALLRNRQHEMANHVAILIDASERQEAAHVQMANELRGIREDAERREQRVITRIEQHDLRDDDRFRADGARLNVVERILETNHALEDAEISRVARLFDRRSVMRAAWVGLAATILGALIGIAAEKLMTVAH